MAEGGRDVSRAKGEPWIRVADLFEAAPPVSSAEVQPPFDNVGEWLRQRARHAARGRRRVRTECAQVTSSRSSDRARRSSSPTFSRSGHSVRPTCSKTPHCHVRADRCSEPRPASGSCSSRTGIRVQRDRGRNAPDDAAARGSGTAAYVAFTSGRSGLPKGVRSEHTALARVIAWFIDAMRVDSESRGHWSGGLAATVRPWRVCGVVHRGHALRAHCCSGRTCASGCCLDASP